MKKILLAVALVMAMSLTAQAQHFVVKAGLDFTKLSSLSLDVKESWNAQTGFHAGVGYQVDLGLFSIQPELLYTRARTNYTGNAGAGSYDFRIDHLNLPVNLQLGLNLLFIRPYIFAAPFIGYTLVADGNLFGNDQWKDLNRFDYGIGIGAGIELWKIQISGKYNWNFGKPFNNGKLDLSQATFNNIDDAHLRGFQLSVAFLF